MRTYIVEPFWEFHRKIVSPRRHSMEEVSMRHVLSDTWRMIAMKRSKIILRFTANRRLKRNKGQWRSKVKVENVHLELGIVGVIKRKGKGFEPNAHSRYYHQHCRVRINVLVWWIITSLIVLYAQHLKILEVILSSRCCIQLLERMT